MPDDQIIYRSRGVALFDEDAQPWEPRKRTRVSARFDRTHWEKEYFHPFVETFSPYDPRPKNPFNTQTFGKSDGFKDDPKPVDEKRVSKTHVQHRYTKEEVEVVTHHGKYKLLQVIEFGVIGIRVRAVCEGGFCDGKVRYFGPGEWLDVSRTKCCPRCDARQKREDLYEQMQRDVKQTHGVYQFIHFEIRGNDSDHFVRRVRAICTGGCGGRMRSFAYRAWQDGTEGLTGCYQCTQIKRRKRAPTKPLTKLDAAAEEMREMERVG